MRKLGTTQESVLKALREHGGTWSHRGIASGWVWGSAGQTARILDTLVKRGLVTKDEKGVYKAV